MNRPYDVFYATENYIRMLRPCCNFKKEPLKCDRVIDFKDKVANLAPE